MNRERPSEKRARKKGQARISSKNPAAARRAAETIVGAVRMLQKQPHIGRPVDDMDPEFRELVIDYGDSGYIARYRLAGDQVIVLAVRHQKEAGE